MAIDRDGEGPPLRREERAQAQPSRGDELRASPFTEDVFDDEYYGRRRRGGGISFGTIAAVIFVSAVVAAMGWYVFADRGETTMVEGGAPVVKADPMPYKYQPDNPGGLQVANQDKLIYDRVAKNTPPQRVENLLPEPEAPRAPPVKAPDPPKPPPAAPTAAPQAAKAPPPAPAKVAEPAPEPAPEEPKKDAMADLVAQITGETKKAPEAQAPPPESQPVAAAPAAVPAASSPMLLVPKATEDAAPVPTQMAAAVPPAPAAPVPAAAIPGALSVQLVSVPSQDAAMAEWKRISGKNADILAGYSPSVVQAEVPGKGTYYRLRIGPLADKPAADALCAQLAQRSVSCIPVRQ